MVRSEDALLHVRCFDKRPAHQEGGGEGEQEEGGRGMDGGRESRRGMEGGSEWVKVLTCRLDPTALTAGL